MTSDVRGNKPDPLPLQFNPANHRNPPSSLRRASQVVLSSFPGASTTRDASRSSLSMMVLNDNEGAFCLRLAVRHPTFLQSPHAQLNPTALRSSALCTLTHRLALQCAFRPSRPQGLNVSTWAARSCAAQHHGLHHGCLAQTPTPFSAPCETHKPHRILSCPTPACTEQCP